MRKPLLAATALLTILILNGCSFVGGAARAGTLSNAEAATLTHEVLEAYRDYEAAVATMFATDVEDFEAFEAAVREVGARSGTAVTSVGMQLIEIAGSGEWATTGFTRFTNPSIWSVRDVADGSQVVSVHTCFDTSEVNWVEATSGETMTLVTEEPATFILTVRLVDDGYDQLYSIESRSRSICDADGE